MENSNKIIPPHLNAEVYRTDTTGTNTLSYLDHIHLNEDGSVLVGSSELTGRYWNGAANILNSVSEGQKEQTDKRSIYLTSGTPDGCFIESSSKVLLCEDNGTVSIWTTTEDAWKVWKEDESVTEHDDAALAVDCLIPGKEYVTVGADGNIKVWDINEMICIRNYNKAHNKAIYGVAVCPKTQKTFATGSSDKFVSLWDDDVTKPVLELVKNNCGIRCLQWLDEQQLIYGDEAGVLRLVDIRNADSTIKLTEFPAAIHRLAIQPESNKIAVCCDNKIVSVYEIGDDTRVKEVYHDRHMHSNYVRGLAWNCKEKNELHSVGWDGAIRTHKIVVD